MIALKLIFLLFCINLTIQDEDSHRCAKYTCSTTSKSCANVQTRFDDAINQVTLAPTCNPSEKCDIPVKPWQTLSYAEEDKAFSCVYSPIEVKRYPGEDCFIDTDCVRGTEGSCVNMKCIGATVGQDCKKDDECVVGTYCDQDSKQCAKQKQFGAECNNSYECINSLLCQKKTCSVAPFSLQIDAEVEGDFEKHKCALGFIHNGKCASFKQIDLDPSTGNTRKCELGEKCAYTINGSDDTITLDCECGYNKDGFGYCPRGHESSK
jgi:hypothetical protein